ncbi:MAG: pilus assembly protein [Lachnospira sp.]|nr:pilus assembly protein [Lachnospira sp.]
MNIQTICLTTPKTKKGTYFSASSTVEAALVIPLFMYAAMALIYILQIAAVKQHVQTALYEDAKELAGYAYSVEKSVDMDLGSLSTGAAWTLLVNELGSSYASDNHIVGGNAGLVMVRSKVCGGDSSVIDLSVTYTVQNPFDIFGIGKVTITQRCKTDAWLGESRDSYRNKQSREERKVYVTAEGKVYHTNRNCTYLTRVITQKNRKELASIRNYDGGRYFPCEKCGHQYDESEMVYITQYGNRFHTDITCSQLARTIIEIPISKVGTKSLCKKCGGNHG